MFLYYYFKSQIAKQEVPQKLLEMVHKKGRNGFDKGRRFGFVGRSNSYRRGGQSWGGSSNSNRNGNFNRNSNFNSRKTFD